MTLNDKISFGNNAKFGRGRTRPNRTIKCNTQ